MFQGHINELISCLKVTSTLNLPNNEQYKLEPQAQEDIKQFLRMEQDGIAHLIHIINNDMMALKKISEGMTQLTNQR